MILTQDRHKALFQLSYAYIASRALHVAAELGIADHLGNTPDTVDNIAKRAQVSPAALHRLIGLLSCYDIFAYTKEGKITHTPLSELMQTDHPDSFRALLMLEDTTRWNAMGHLDYCVKTGKPSFEHLYDTDYFSYVRAHPDISKRVDEAMSNFSQYEEAILSTAYDFSPFSLIADIGGGKGGLLTRILQANQHARGILFDQAEVVQEAGNIQAAKLTNRCDIIAGNFFDSIPQGADLYILKRVIHDWGDKESIQILKNVHKACRPSSKILIMDAVDSNSKEAEFTKIVDIMTMPILTGKERTEAEFNTLLAQAGFKVDVIKPTNSMLSIIEASLQ